MAKKDYAENSQDSKKAQDAKNSAKQGQDKSSNTKSCSSKNASGKNSKDLD